MQIKQKLENKNHEALWIYVRKQPGTEQVKDYDKLKPHSSFFSAKGKEKSNRAVLLQNDFARSQRPTVQSRSGGSAERFRVPNVHMLHRASNYS